MFFIKERARRAVAINVRRMGRGSNIWGVAIANGGGRANVFDEARMRWIVPRTTLRSSASFCRTTRGQRCVRLFSPAEPPRRHRCARPLRPAESPVDITALIRFPSKTTRGHRCARPLCSAALLLFSYSFYSEHRCARSGAGLLAPHPRQEASPPAPLLLPRFWREGG